MASDRSLNDIRYAINETDAIIKSLRCIASDIRAAAENVGEEKCSRAIEDYISQLQSAVNCMRKVV